MIDKRSSLQRVTPKCPFMVGQLPDLQGIPQIVVASLGIPNYGLLSHQLDNISPKNTYMILPYKAVVAGDPVDQFHLYKSY